MLGASIHPKKRLRPALARARERADHGRFAGLLHIETMAGLYVEWAMRANCDFSGLCLRQMGSNFHQHLLVFYVQ